MAVSERESSCAICNIPTVNPKSRRKLHSAGNEQVLSVLSCLIGEVFVDSSAILPRSAYACRPCYRRVERLLKLRGEVDTLQSEIRNLVASTGDAHGLQRISFERPLSPQLEQLQATANEQCHTPVSRKRCRDLSVANESSAAKRRRSALFAESTPVRQSVKQIDVIGSPAVGIVVKEKKKTRLQVVSRSSGLKSLVKGVARKSTTAIAQQAMEHPQVRKKVVTILKRDIQKEIRNLCSKTNPSILRNSEPESLMNFSWELVTSELRERAPTLHSLLCSCIEVKRRQRRSTKGKKTKSNRPSNTAVMGVCTAILLRHNNVHMNLLQRIVGVLLNAGHASKQTYTRLQKLLMSLSHQRTLHYLDQIGSGYDSDVLIWRDILQQDMNGVECPQAMHVQQGSTGATPSHSVSTENVTTVQGSEISTSCSESDISTPLMSPISPSTTFDSLSELSEQSLIDESMDLDEIFGPQAPGNSHNIKTYKLVGDNIDKRVNPREMRSDYQARDLHYFHTYGVKDRVDTSKLSCEEVPLSLDISSMQLDNLLPTCNDEEALRNNFAIMVARTLMKYLPFFKEFGQGLEYHIRHEYYEEMSMKSEVVPLGIYLKGEQKLEEMVEVLDHLHQYVPTITTVSNVQVTGPEDTREVFHDKFHKIAFGGDQMTASRIRGSQRARSNANHDVKRLKGFTPVVEDWHAKVCLLGVIWVRLYSASSGMDAGTLYQLRNLINRRNVKKKPAEAVTACEEFFLLASEAHILSAAMTEFKMKTREETPSEESIPVAAHKLDSLERRKILLIAAKRIVDKFVSLSYGEEKSSHEDTVDHVQEYASEVLSLGLLLMEFEDAIKEGDGLRLLRCWRYFLLFFKAARRSNYSIEAFTLLAQYTFRMSPRMAHQLLWSRTVNTTGRPGKNIPCDLAMEHLNRDAKNSLSGLGSNITDESVKRVGRCLAKTVAIATQFDSINGVRTPSGRHSSRSSLQDMDKILKLLLCDKQVFNFESGRKHTIYPKFRRNMIRYVSTTDLNKWMHKQLSHMAMFS